MPDSQTAGGEIQLSCIQSHPNTSHLQRLPSEAPHGHSVSLAQCKSKAINVSPALNCGQCFEHFTSPRLLCELHFQPESHPKLLSDSSCQQLQGDSETSALVLCCPPCPAAQQQGRKSLWTQGRAAHSKQHHTKATKLSASRRNKLTFVDHEDENTRATWTQSASTACLEHKLGPPWMQPLLSFPPGFTSLHPPARVWTMPPCSKTTWQQPEPRLGEIYGCVQEQSRCTW